uniref:zinc finger E-box-binding homeobox 1 n=1 Tax=Scatophagus argus TaxID=75038 RepID=UPI001ED82463|nr:zinc finger E-box-binding homeobox 1 [Scatophagus argus]XP_046256577.1 zinc finger E-box-binding homeobox 1 [Scatophagus argus]XP_046256579.1 zinc finger E-box-binding homeobox 1 [Scatophagus argus]XP_046256580.1 zinc finger E-box-binding homeobox 1 [Scatophagus argus]
MDSQLASVLTSGSLNVQNGSQCAEGSGPVTEVFLEPKEKTSSSTVPGNLQYFPVKAAVTIRQDALSINGKKPEVGGTCKPASQETSKIVGFRQPITVKTGVPVLRSRPIRLKIVVPPQRRRPITNSAISLTKDFQFRRPVSVSSGAVITEKHRSNIQVSAGKNEGEIKGVTYQQTEDDKPDSFHETEAERLEKMCKEGDVLGAKIHTNGTESPLTSSTNTFKILSKQGIKEETTEGETGENTPIIFREMDFKSCKTFDKEDMEEQTEPLDLSLPKKRESRERRCGRFLEDCGCESLLIMEVDEYEGEGDRDIVEEDNEGYQEDSVLHVDSTDTLEDSLLSPSFFSTSVFTSLSSIDGGDTDNFLFIDDQGIPYTLSPDGLKVPQLDAFTSETPQSDQANSAEVVGRGSPRLAPIADPSLSQSLDNALNVPSDDHNPTPAHATDSLSLAVDQAKTPEVFTSLITNSDGSKAAEPSVTSVQANAVLSPSSEISVPTQPIQILTNPSTNTPILLLSSSSSSSQFSSAPVGVTLPFSVTQTACATSAPMFLLLSSVPSSPGDSASASTPMAVLDPSTGQLAQITAASAPVSLSLPSGQVSTLGSPLPPVSHPIIRLSPNNPPVILSGVNSVNSGSVLTSLMARSSPPALQNDNHSSSIPLLLSQISSSDSNSGSEAISVEEVPNENNKPSTSTASSPHPQAASLSYDPLARPGSEAQSPASEPQFDPSDLHSQHLPLDDHLYFSNSAAPPSPASELSLSSGKLKPPDPLDPLDPLSPAASPNAMGPRRVLYCQLCPRVFFYLSDLERHAITHSQKKPHVCQQCGKAFKRSSHLQRHKHIHTGQRNFVCPICGKRFREAGELQRHQRVHTGEKPYQCQLCHTRFAERNTLRRHTKRKHPYHQVAMEMLNERGGGGRGAGGGGGGGSGVQEQESAEWYSSTVSNLDNSESEGET